MRVTVPASLVKTQAMGGWVLQKETLIGSLAKSKLNDGVSVQIVIPYFIFKGSIFTSEISFRYETYLCSEVPLEVNQEPLLFNFFFFFLLFRTAPSAYGNSQARKESNKSYNCQPTPQLTAMPDP